MNPFVRFGKYFGEKSTKQKILFVIGALLISTFVFFFIKGNFFDNRGGASSEMSQTYSEGTSQDEGSTQNAPEKATKFHIGIIDIVILLVLIAVYVVRLIIKKRNNRRM